MLREGRSVSRPRCPHYIASSSQAPIGGVRSGSPIWQVLLRGHSTMYFAVWRAFLYKSFSIYKNKYVMTTLDIIWPCLVILFMNSTMTEPSDNSHFDPGGNRQNGLQSMPLQLDQKNNFTKSGAKSMNMNELDGQFTKPKFQDQNIWNEKKYQDGEIKVIKRSIEPQALQGHPLYYEMCTITCSLFVLLCFIGTWNGAGTLAHAERMSGTVERMRMYGISDLSIICSYVMHAGIKQLISALLISLYLKFGFGDPQIVERLDFFSLFVTIFLVSLHSTVYFLGVASFFNSSILRGIVGNVSFIYFYLWALKQNFSLTAQYFGHMFAPFCLVTLSTVVCGLEAHGGVTLESLISATDRNDIPLLVIPLLMIFGSAVVLLVFFYLLNINPGPYGSARPICFILPQGLQGCFRPSHFKGHKSKSGEKFRNGLYELTPLNIEVGIKIENLYKKYGNLTSVKNLSLNIYMGQITALLGHNGAGKTTTLSILSGMLSSTSGSAFYQGYDIFTNLKKFRKDIGLCPQNNLLHPNLDVNNHLIFFGMLSGLSKKDAEESANDLLKVVGIFEKKYAQITELSGGMQRKLCIALSLVGKPKVVILDEPTSGVDPESRREIWNILLESRENRILLLTTHFMEEADALGDQIAIMNHGEIVCYGSPMFLKKHYGAGYNITVSCSQDKHKKIIETVTEKIPQATIIGETQEWIKLKLPFNKTEHFPELFKQLESDNKTSRISINCTTMEDVYLNLIYFTGAGYNITVSCSQDKHKKIIETVTEKIPQATIIGETQEWIKLKLPFNKTEHFPELFKQLESDNKTSRISINCTTMEDVYLKVEAEEGGEIPTVSESPLPQEKYTNEKGNIMAYFYRFMELVKKNMICSLARWFKTFLVIVICPLVATYVAMDGINTDLTKYHRLNRSQDLNVNLSYGNSSVIPVSIPCFSDPVRSVRIYLFSLWVSYVIFIVSSTFFNFVHKERISTVKHLILMTGISPLTYWSSVLLWDAMLYLIFVIISWITFLTLDYGTLFDTGSGIYVLFLVLFLSGMSMISSVYFVSLLFKTMRSVVVFYFTAVFTIGFIGNFIANISSNFYSKVMKLQPFTASMLAMVDFSTLAEKKRNCKYCVTVNCPDILKSAFLKDDQLWRDLMFLVGDFFLYFSLAVLTDYGLFPFLWNKIDSIFTGTIDNTGLKRVVSDVAREKSRVDGLLTADTQKDKIAIVDGLGKKYSRSMVAVVDVTFAVSKGECFGLLGVNGAGKSTTFNMLTGVLYPTKGNVFIKGHSLSKEKTKCLSMIGYCPQHTALIESLTSKQMLTLFARLRMIPSQYVDKEVKKWITLFGLDEYSDVPSKNYSGGNKRKLNAALAFIGDPFIILLDEPTSGVDPFIRRNLWRVIEACGSYDQAIIISSHSMDECEAVCNRLTIMVGGKMECIGKTQYLKRLYGTGYVIKITLSPHTDNEITTLKNIIESTFSPHCELKDEHQVLLHYLIRTNFYKISSLFNIMEGIKNQSNIVNDYIITDSSLEEVFLGFAKNQ